MNVSIILSTYNNPEWLEKVFWGYINQSFTDFELVIADDGSGSSTLELINRYKKESKLNIKHVWHEDNGFQKCVILNKAIQESGGDYLIFSDGDCIPRKDFVSKHIKNSGEGLFLSGGYCKLPMSLSQLIKRDHVDHEDAFDPKWLKQNGFKRRSSLFKISHGPIRASLSDRLTPTKATWNGCNSSTFKSHILDVNGHNEDMQYGGEDREMGERMINMGVKPVQIRNRAILLHLDHERGYRTDYSITKNKSIRLKTKNEKLTWSMNGIIKSKK